MDQHQARLQQVRQALALACLASGTGVKAAGARGVCPTRSALINASNRALHAGVCVCVFFPRSFSASEMALALQRQTVLSWFSSEKLYPGRLPAVGKNWCTAERSAKAGEVVELKHERVRSQAMTHKRSSGALDRHCETYGETVGKQQNDFFFEGFNLLGLSASCPSFSF